MPKVRTPAATPATRYASPAIRLEPGQEPVIEGLENLGGGMSRVVYSLGNGHVLKVARGAHRTGDNLTEAVGWATVAGTEYEDLFARVVACDPEGAWLVMEEVPVNDVPPEKRRLTPKNRSRATKAIRGLVDLHINNVGVRGGKQVIIDYAWVEQGDSF